MLGPISAPDPAPDAAKHGLQLTPRQLFGRDVYELGEHWHIGAREQLLGLARERIDERGPGRAWPLTHPTDHAVPLQCGEMAPNGTARNRELRRQFVGRRARAAKHRDDTAAGAVQQLPSEHGHRSVHILPAFHRAGAISRVRGGMALAGLARYSVFI